MPLAVDIQNLRIVRNDIPIVDGVTCAIEQGTCTALLGPNGCGKTTLTRAMTGQTFISEGSVKILGEEIGSTDVRALRKRIGVVNPNPGNSHSANSGAVVDADLSAFEVVLTGFFGTIGLYDKATDDQKDQARHMLKSVGLSHRQDLRFSMLSTGEQRRAMIARALAHQPELLILDETTAGLDIAGREQVLATIEMILSRPNPPTMLMITHHVEELSPRTKNVLLMRNGRVVAQGTPYEVVTPEYLTQTFGCKVFVKKIHGRFWLEVLPEAWLDLVPRT